jgi:hypothetical protein
MDFDNLITEANVEASRLLIERKELEAAAQHINSRVQVNEIAHVKIMGAIEFIEKLKLQESPKGLSDDGK